MGNSDKRKAREREKKKELARRRDQKARKDGEIRRQWEKIDGEFKPKEDLLGRVLLQTIGITEDPHTVSEAKYYIAKTNDFLGIDGDLEHSLHNLFELAHGITPDRWKTYSYGREKLVIDLGHSIATEIQRYETIAQGLLESRIGKAIDATPDITQKSQSTCEHFKKEIEDWSSTRSRTFESEPEEDPYEPDEEQSKKMDFDFFVDDMLKNVLEPHMKIERFRAGVPRDFYSDVAEVVTTTNYESALWFIKQVYTLMSTRDFALKEAFKSSKGLYRFSTPLRVCPGTVLPDPAHLKDLARVTKRISSLNGAQGAILGIAKLTEAGDTLDQAVNRLEKIGIGQRAFAVVSAASKEETGAFLIDQLAENPCFVEAYETLGRAGFTPSTSFSLLRNYGDYPLNGKNFAQTLIELARKPEALRLIAEHALSICCSEGASILLDHIRDSPGSTTKLTTYLEFSRSSPLRAQAYALALGQHGLEKLTHLIKDSTEYQIIEALKHPPEELESRLQTATMPSQVLSRHHRVYTKYHLHTELTDVKNKEAFETCLDLVVGTRYEPALLGQRKLFKRFVAAHAEDPYGIAKRLRQFKSEGDIYRHIKALLNPPSEKSIDSTTAFSRIVLVADEERPEVVLYLSEQSGREVRFVHVDSSPNKFEVIQSGDCVVLCTSHTSHSSSYLAKHLATRRGAIVRHTTHTNAELIYEAIRHSA